MSYTIAINKQFNSLEISFTEKPSEAVRNILKSFKFRWNPKKSIWYGFAEQEEISALFPLLSVACGGSIPPATIYTIMQ